MQPSPVLRTLALVGLGLLCLGLAAINWWYTQHGAPVVGPLVIPTAPGGQWSDLYLSWRGAQAWRQGSDPYSLDLIRAIHRELWGAALPPDQAPPITEGVLYPVSLLVLLAPLTAFPWPALAPWLTAATLALIGAASLGWWVVAGGPGGRLGALGAVVLGASTLPAIGATNVQQPSAWSVAALAGGAVLLGGAARAAPASRARYALGAGLLFALATIKPQTSVLPLLAVLPWVAARPALRRPVLGGFVGAQVLLLGIPTVLHPGWIAGWLTVARRYAESEPVRPLVAILPGPGAWLAQGLLVGLLGVVAWQARLVAPGTAAWAGLWGLAGAVSYLVFPSWAHHQLLLYPGVYAVWRAAGARPVPRWSRAVVLTLAVLPFAVAALAALAPQWSLGAAYVLPGLALPVALVLTLAGTGIVPVTAARRRIPLEQGP